MNINYNDLKEEISDDYIVENLEQIVTFRIRNSYLKIYLTKDIIYNAELVDIKTKEVTLINYTKYPELRKLLGNAGFFNS